MQLQMPEWFASKVDRSPDGCDRWTGHVNKLGYGLVYVPKNSGIELPSARRQLLVHRVSWYLHTGYWPDTLDHVCHQPEACSIEPCPHRSCTKFDHLSDGTQSDNMAKGRVINRNGQKTHCRHGHEYTEENTRFGTRGNGQKFRICLTCERVRTHAKRGPEKAVHAGPRRMGVD